MRQVLHDNFPKRRERRRRRALTLIEVTVVIGIVSLLLALLLPALHAARRAGWRAHCLSNQRQIGQTLLSRASGKEGYLPLAGHVTLRESVDPDDDLPHLLGDVHRKRYDYNKQVTAFPVTTVLAPLQISLYRHLAPDDPDPRDGHAEIARAGASSLMDLFKCHESPLETGEHNRPAESLWFGDQGYVYASGLPLDYAFNAGVMGYHHNSAYQHLRLRGDLSRVGDSSQVALLGDADGGPTTAHTLSWSPALGLEDVETTPSLADVLGNTAAVQDSARLDPFLHGGRLNVLFVDGHAGTFEIRSDPLERVLLLAPPQ